MIKEREAAGAEHFEVDLKPDRYRGYPRGVGGKDTARGTYPGDVVFRVAVLLGGAKIGRVSGPRGDARKVHQKSSRNGALVSQRFAQSKAVIGSVLHYG